MKLSKVSASRRLLFIPIALFALATIIGQSLVAPASAAPTKQECWDQLNNKPYEYSRQTIDKQNLINSCKSAGFCTVSSFDLATNITTLSCANPSSLGSTTVGKTDAEVKPLVTLVCGNTPTSDRLMDAYVQCGDNVRKIYSSCNYTGGSITSNMQDTVANSSKCVYGKLSNPKPSASAVTDAVQAGRNAANNIVDGAIADQAKKELQAKCDERAKAGENVEWNGTECAPKADSKTTCAVNGIGWIVCPVMNFLSSLMDKMIEFLGENFLQTEADLVQANDSNGTYVAWKVFRNYANVAFIGVFLFIIYSQITGAGASNYGLKRMLPRLITAAILVNVSFFICQLAIDASNLVGFGISELFNGITQQVATSGTAQTTGAGSWESTIGAVMIAGAGLALALALGILVPALLAALMIVIILLIRKALIVLLIVVAPLAFVAYLLPNTEQWFKKWYKMLFNLLMVFPIIAAVFGGSKLAASIINTIGATATNAATGEEDAKLSLQLIALGITVVPFFVVPALLKGAIAASGAIGARLGNYSDRANKRVGARSKEGYLGRQMAERKKLAAARNAQIAGGTYKGKYGKWNPRNLRSATSGVLNRSKVTGRAGDRMGAIGAAVSQKDQSEEVENEVARMSSEWGPHEELSKASEAYAAALHSGDVVKARAAQKILLGKGNAGIAEIRKGVASTDSMSDQQRLDNKAIAYARGDLASAGIKGKDAALNAWSYDSKSRSLSSHDASAGTFDGLTDAEMAGQSAGSLEKAISAGGLTAERAAGMQDNPNVWQNLSEDKRKVIIGAQTRVRDTGAAHEEALAQNALYDMNNKNNGPSSNP